MARTAEINMQQILEDIEGICSSAPSRAETLVESYLEHQLGSLSMPERIACLEKLTSSDQSASQDTSASHVLDGHRRAARCVCVYTIVGRLPGAASAPPAPG